jgi:hypothetical protein
MAGRRAAVDLSAWLLRRTPPRPLVVTAPGGTAARLAVEKAVRTRGWRAAMSPAEANILVVAGPALEPYAGRLWEAMPAPRARVDVVGPAEVPDALDAAVRTLGDVDLQRDMDVVETSGDIPMADRAEDRDGLTLDQLHVPLGPALPLWPAGLIVHTRLQGDVIQHATVEVLTTGHHDPFWESHVPRYLDSSARLLDLAGWTDAATLARRLRDGTLDGVQATATQAWARRVRRSRTLRWLLTDVGPDALARLHHWLDALTQPTAALPGADETQRIVDALPTMLDGAELATARLIVASLDPDLDVLTHA